MLCGFGVVMCVALGAFAEAEKAAETSAKPRGDSKRELAPPADIRLVAASVSDTRGNGPAAHLLVPEGWKVDAQVAWDPGTTALPTARVSIRDEKDGRAILLLPRREFVWRYADDPRSPRPLSNARLEQKPPFGDAIVYLEHEVISALHPNGARAEIQQREPLPQVARAVAAGGWSTKDSRDVSAARVRTSTTENGETLDSDVYCVLVQSRTPAAGEELVRWGPELAYMLRARRGELERASGLMEAIVASFRIDPEWWNRQGGPAIAGDRAREREFEDAASLRQRVSTALAAHYGRTEIYFDSRTEREVHLPRGYRQAWANARGDYLLSSNPSRDPRTEDPGGEWAELFAVSAR
jgi:hypothetical protein